MNEKQPASERKCHCGRPQRWVEDPLYPIEFDEQTGEYQIVHNGARINMEYCFKCGGRLPESRRDSLFMTPDVKEMAEIEDLLRDARSVADVVRAIGPPDEIHKGAFDVASLTTEIDLPNDGRVITWKQQLDYRERWKSLVLNVQEAPDGRIMYIIGGKLIATNE